MRLLLFLPIIGMSILISLFRPFWGLLVFTWLAYMRPQDLVWASVDMRFSYYIAIALLLGCFLNANKEKIFTKARENYLLIALWVMFGISTIFSVWPGQSSPKFWELTKIIFIAILTGGLVSTKKRFRALCWVIALSFSFFAVKGALRAMLTGVRLQGPTGSMIADNNDFALALNMVLPLFIYLGLNEKERWKKLFFYFQFPFFIIAIIYTFSRGGALGLVAVLSLLILKSRKKFLGFFLLIVGIFLFVNFAPQGYKERLQTIKTYQEDKSAMGRIYAWQAAWGMAKDRPLTGVGFKNFTMMFPQYNFFAPRMAHNSYLQIMADNGFIAMGLFLLLLLFSISRLRKLRKIIPFNNATSWVHNYTHMLEVGFAGYMVSGFFLSRADFDLMYQFIGMTVALEQIVNKELKTK